MAHDEYYTGKGEADAEADGEWTDEARKNASRLKGPVSRPRTSRRLNGIDPKDRRAPHPRLESRMAPWLDMTLSAPKIGSRVMWALSPAAERTKMEAAHRAGRSCRHRASESDHSRVTAARKGGAIRRTGRRA